MPVADILLDDNNYAFSFFIDHFKKKWQLDCEPFRDENSLGMIIDDRVIGCAFVPQQVTESALVQSARENVLWTEAEAGIAKHKSHLKVAMTKEGDPVAAHILFSKIIYSLLQQKNVIGVYLRPGLFEPSYYIKYAEELTRKMLPTELWVHINSIDYDKEEGFSFFTTGMTKFGKKEFEITETKKNFIDAYYFLKELIKHTIENNVTFKHGDTVGTDETKIPLSVSKGVKVKDHTIKINL